MARFGGPAKRPRGFCYHFHWNDRWWYFELWSIVWPSGSGHHHGALDWSAHPLVATTKFAFAPHVVHAGGRSYIQPRSRHHPSVALACRICVLFYSSH